MNNNMNKKKSLTRLIGLFFLISAISLSVQADSLYIGDGGDNSVKRFDASAGTFQGNFVAPGSGGLSGPRGVIFLQGRLLVVNQNALTDDFGEILRYRRNDGAFTDALIPCNPPLGRLTCNPDGPFIPRGLIRGLGDTILVADLFSQGANFQPPGHIKEVSSKTGAFVRNYDTTGFNAPFFPRGIVRGPDGLIYVSVIGSLDPEDPAFDPLSGYILRFNPRSGKLVDTLVSNPADNPSLGCTQHLHRPEGLVFGPDNNLYVTSFRANSGDIDRILVFNRKGQCLANKTIELDVAGQDRSFAQALVFGPKGRLFVPMNNTGEVRRYNVNSKTYDIFVAAGGELQNPWFLTFGDTNPRTLKYED